ncbi:MAG: hypothetical protein ACRDHS_12785, partial [Actinomycetota bacterium]
MATIVGVILLRPTGRKRPDVSPLGVYEGVYEGTGQRVELVPCMGAQPTDELTCRRLVVRVDGGPDVGRSPPSSSSSRRGSGVVQNGEILATEVVRTLVG